MRTVFIGTPAYLGRIDGETRCAFRAEEPTDHGHDPARLVTVDLAMTPAAAARQEIAWNAVQVDDCFSGRAGAVGGTPVGPARQELRLTGAAYEGLTCVYWPDTTDPRAGRRYCGHQPGRSDHHRRR